MTPTLTLRDLNRAILARQMLLAREKIAPLAAVERLFAIQAQWPKPPFIALWSRLQGFSREPLLELLRSRKLVRGTLMRATIHLVTATDYLRVRPALQPSFTRFMGTILKGGLERLDLARVLSTGRKTFAERPRTFGELREAVAARHPGLDPRAIGFSVRMQLPLVQVPDASDWGFPGDANFALAERWIGKRVPGKRASLADLVLRHLSILGPASVAEMQAWLGLQGLREVVESLRPRLLELRDSRGRELFDLPKAPRPPGDTPAPVRFLPEFDNPIVCRADERFVAAAHRARIYLSGLRVLGTVLVDGFAAAIWQVRRKKSAATVVVEAFAPLSRRQKDAIAEEGEPLLRFLEPGATALEVKFGKLG
jgi:hypothetical protein